MEKYNQIIKESHYWRQIAQRYNLPLNNLDTNFKHAKQTDERFLSDGVVSS